MSEVDDKIKQIEKTLEEISECAVESSQALRVDVDRLVCCFTACLDIFRTLSVRHDHVTPVESISVNGITVDESSRSVKVAGYHVELTGIEFDLLLVLIKRAGCVVSRTSLWCAANRDVATLTERTVDVHISKLRKKLGEDRIQTVRGVGYVLLIRGFDATS